MPSYSAHLFFELCKLIEADPVPRQSRDLRLRWSDCIELQYPDASTRPARLTAGDLVDPREDYGR